ncbi:MAG: L-serine dehydratase [Arenicella sp.]|jgi:L-serine dehydratase
MAISVLDLFKIGIGPSSSHTVGPMCASKWFVDALKSEQILNTTVRVKAEMYGSLGATGIGHGTPKAVILGLLGEAPETVDIASVEKLVEDARTHGKLLLSGEQTIKFDYKADIVLHRRKSLPFHSNGMRFSAFDADKNVLLTKVYYSVGGGFVVDEHAAENTDPLVSDARELEFPFTTGAAMLEQANKHGLPISQLMMRNESSWRPEAETRAKLLEIWQVMQDCVKTGLQKDGELPGGLRVARRAQKLHQHLLSHPEQSLSDPLSTLDWVTLYALSVNEENAAGGRVVTAPTNGAAGIIPAVLHYYVRFVPNASDEGVIRFLLTAAAIGILYKENASISGAEVGCQGEVGSACSMAAGALAELLGGTPEQVENAAEIAMEHNLGLTCDPIGGLVQVPCIERNAMASVKAIHAARLSMRGDGTHFVSLDKVIRTMRDTGRDMSKKYKETSRGGLALDVIEVAVNIVEC